MMALQLLPLVLLIIIFCSPLTLSYPVYGTKRYGRTPATQQQVPQQHVAAAATSWGGHMQPYQQQQMMRAQRYPVNYYEMYPYNQNYADDYYYPDAMNYPVYYPPARTSKYEVYQAVLPYYYDPPLVRANNYGYYGYDDSSDEEQQNDREQREEAQPIGQEMYFENDGSAASDENLNDVNAAFLQNLIMTQMYKDRLEKQQHSSQFKDASSKQLFKDGMDKPYTAQEKQFLAAYKDKQFTSLYKDSLDKQQPTHMSQYQESAQYPSSHDQQYMSQYQDDLDKQFAMHPKQYPHIHDQYMPQYQDSLDKQYPSQQQYKDGLDKQYPQLGLADKHLFEDDFNSDFNPSGGTGYDQDFYGDYTKQDYFKDDEDELELKQLAKPAQKTSSMKKPSSQERQRWFQRDTSKKPNAKQLKTNDDYYWEQKRNFGKNTNVFVDRKVAVRINPALHTEAPTVAGGTTTTTLAPKRDSRGMKEEVLLRPATPAKHPFAASFMNMMSKKDFKDRQRTPSVYDTIKHMLDIEKSLDNKHDELKPTMRKRIISSEDSLTHQLTVLKKQK